MKYVYMMFVNHTNQPLTIPEFSYDEDDEDKVVDDDRAKTEK